MIRQRVYYSGRVQGVGFRMTASRIASGYRVGGTVRNLPDGQVELVIEGEEPEVENVLQDIREAMAGYIADERAESLPLGEPFSGFRVIA